MELIWQQKRTIVICIRYQEAADKNKYGYEIKFYDHLQGLCNDLDKKIRKGNERLSVRPDDSVSSLCWFKETNSWDWQWTTRVTNVVFFALAFKSQ